jgi:hypothetical protein
MASVLTWVAETVNAACTARAKAAQHKAPSRMLLHGADGSVSQARLGLITNHVILTRERGVEPPGGGDDHLWRW